jgi:hypothetical protein
MKLGYGDDAAEISFAQNKDECLDFVAVDEELEALDYGPSADDTCKFWVCDEGILCTQHASNLANQFLFLGRDKYKSFNRCAQECECTPLEKRYWTEVEGEIISVCCDAATEFSDLTPVPDESSGGYKLECQPKCILPECGKWYCKGGGIPSVNEVGCAEFTEGGVPAPEGVEFYVDQSTCESQSKCGQWWCNGSGVCQPITQDNAAPSSEENLGGAFFEDPAQCQEWGCGKYYCNLLDQGDPDYNYNNVQPECIKIDGQTDDNIRLTATKFDTDGECGARCGKYYCHGAATEETPCRQIQTKTGSGIEGGAALFDNRDQCGDNGCLYKWVCEGSDCSKVLAADLAAAFGFDSSIACCLACDNCSGHECPPGNQYNPATDQCEPA